MTKFKLSKRYDSHKNLLTYYSTLRFGFLENKTIEKYGMRQCSNCKKLYSDNFFLCQNCEIKHL